MQYKKADTKNKILESAVDEFYKFGDNASIRRIAENAGVAVGNIYNYFGGKKELNDAIILPVAKEINNFFVLLNNSELSFRTIDGFADLSIPYMIKNRKVIRLLMNTKTDEGDNRKEVYFNLIATKIKSEIDKTHALTGRPPIKTELARAIGKSFLYGVFDILFASNDTESVREILNHYFVFFFKGLEKRL